MNARELAPKRVVVMGANGFVGGAIVKRLSADGTEVLSLGRQEVDLLSANASEELADYLCTGDAFVAVSAMAPAKNASMVVDNLILSGAIVNALKARGDDIVHVVNISSDAVYVDSTTPLTESSATAPDSYHGVMHLAREINFRSELNLPLAVVRPTLIYGEKDPHNGYGPNKFRRLAAAGEDITLFGEGEELRDHVLVDDVAELVRLILLNRSSGVLNAVTGQTASFREIAEIVVSQFDMPVAINGTPRQGAMPHNGYRAFDIVECNKAFPTFCFSPLAEGLAGVHDKFCSGKGS